MSTFWKKIRNQFGTSLAEVMVASGLAAGLALVITQLGKNSTEVSKRADTKSSTQMLGGQINSILTDSGACGYTFGSNLDSAAELSASDLSGATSGAGITLANGGIKKKDNTTFLTTTGKYAEVTILDMKLRYVDITNGTGELYITGTYKLSGKAVQIKPLTIPINIMLNGATWSGTSKCFAAAGNYDSIWTSNLTGDAIYYSSGKVGIGTSAPDASLDIDRNVGAGLFSYWYSTVTPYKGIELQENNYLVWEATTGTTTNSWGLGSVSTGLQVNVKSTSGRPAGVRTIMDFNNDGNIYVYPRTGTSVLAQNFYVDAPVIARTYCQAQPSACNESFSAGVFPKGYSALGGGLAINSSIVNDGSGTNSTALFGYNLIGNGGSLILGDNNTAATVHMYSVPSTSTTATQTIDLTNYERFRFDANSNIILGRVAGGAGTVSATGSPSFVIGGSLATTDITGGRGLVYLASSEAMVSGSVGYGNRAYSRGSMAFGLGNVAGDSAAINVVNGNGITAFAAGAYNIASGTSSVAMGQSSVASGGNAVAIGVASSAIKTDASGVGRGNQANGYGSSAFGYSNTAANPTDAFGFGASAFGYTNNASGDYSVAMGFTNVASGSGSVAIGNSVTANAANVIALGTTFTASGANSVSLVGIGTTGGRAPTPTYGSTTATYATNLGVSNAVSASAATAVGYRNTVNSAAGGGGAFGSMNTASGQDAYAFGRTNTASGSEALAIGGGGLASGSFAMAIGYSVQATAANAISMGHTAYATHASSMIINGANLGATFYSSAANRFSAHFPGGFELCTSLGMGAACTGGVGVQLATGASAFAALSDRNSKKNIVELNEDDELYILQKLKDLPISTWIYKVSKEDSPNNIGPMAQDFNRAFAKVFKLFSNDKLLSTGDVAGINLIATKALIKENEDLKTRIKRLEEQNKIFEMRLRIIEEKVK